MSRTRYLLAWLDPGDPGSTAKLDARNLVAVRREIEDMLQFVPREDVEIDVWLESPGGDAHTAYKLALMLQHAAEHVRVVVPDYAKSAATLLALVGNDIYLAPGAELGPLDAQMPEEGSLSGAISALNIARAADAVAADAVALAGAGGAELLNRTGLSRAETLNAMLRFSASFSEPLVRQLDPKLVHHAKELLRVTARYASRLLTKTGCNDANGIAKRLVEDFPTHGFVISYEDAEDLGLPVQPISEYDLLPAVRAVHRAGENGHEFVDFMPMDEMLISLGMMEDPDADEDENGGEADDQPQEGAGEAPEDDAYSERSNGQEDAAGHLAPPE
jgi:hypothetical protein